VIWTDVVQMTLYVAGAIVSFVVILGKIPGGWDHVMAVAGEANKLTVFDFRFAPTMDFFSRTYSFWAGILGGCFLTTASHGTDQLMVQRLLSARDERQSRRALLSSWAVIFVQFTLFLLIGVLLYVYYGDNHLAMPAQKDRIYPEFVWNNLPPGVAGMIIAAILAAAMANLSAALNSLASTTVVDLYRARGKQVSDASSLKVARAATVVWGIVLLGIAIAARHSKSVLEAGLTIGSIPLGALLGVFLLGVLTKKPRQGAAIAGTIAGLITVIAIHFYTRIAWSWYVLIGTVTTFGVAMVASLFEGPGLPPEEESLVRQPVGALPHLPSQRTTAEE
jgi:SSS family solute:Na+ symporter